MKAENLSFRDFIIYRYARPERLNKRTPGAAKINAALAVLADPDFPIAPVVMGYGRDDILDHIWQSCEYETRMLPLLKILREMYAEYRCWLAALEFQPEPQVYKRKCRKRRHAGSEADVE